jgi:hypothetical protein
LTTSSSSDADGTVFMISTNWIVLPTVWGLIACLRLWLKATNKKESDMENNITAQTVC